MVFNGNDNPVVAGAATPLNNGEISPGFVDYGPIIDVQRLKDEYLFGVPLRAALTGQEVSDETIKNFIKKGIAEFEVAVMVTVTPHRVTDRFDFERADDSQFSARRLTRWPVLKVENLKALFPGVVDDDSNGSSYPTTWVSLNGDSGMVRVIPTNGSMVNGDVNFLASSAHYTAMLGGMKQWPNLWRITYIAGMDFDKVPDLVNDCIGVMAAIKLLSQLGPAIFPFAGQSLGIDGMSQSVSTAGPQWLSGRLQDLKEDRDRLVAQLKSHYCTDFIFGAL